MIDPVRPIAIDDIEAARERIKGTVLRTPLVKLDLGADAPDIRLKLENLQPTNAYKFPGIDATFIHPFDNHDFIAGHATMGLEIVEDCPEVRSVICAIGGGGLITGVGSAIKAKKPDAKVLGAEPETAAPYALSLREGGPQKFSDWQASF